MSLDKGIEHGKEWRRPYYGSSAFDRSCRPHGNCPWCYGNRMHSTRVRLLKGCSLDDEIEEPPKSDRAGEKSPAFCFYGAKRGSSSLYGRNSSRRVPGSISAICSCSEFNNVSAGGVMVCA